MTYDDFVAWADAWRRARAGEGDSAEADARLARLLEGIERPQAVARALLKRAAGAPELEGAWRRLTDELDRVPTLTVLEGRSPADPLIEAAAAGLPAAQALPALGLPAHPYLQTLYQAAADEVLEADDALRALYAALPHLAKLDHVQELMGALKTIGLPLLNDWAADSGPYRLEHEHVELAVATLESVVGAPLGCAVCDGVHSAVGGTLRRSDGAPRLVVTCDDCGAIAEFDAGALGLLDAHERLIAAAEAGARLRRATPEDPPAAPRALAQRRFWGAWVRVRDFGRWLPAEADRMAAGDLVAFAYIDKSCGLTLHAEAVVDPDQPTQVRWCHRRARALVRYRHGTVPEAAWELLSDATRQGLGLPERPEWLDDYEQGAPTEVRALEALDRYRAAEHPDDVLAVLLPPAHAPPDVAAEQVWIRVHSFAQGVLTATLRNEPFEDYGLHFGDRVQATFDPAEPGRGPWIVAAHHHPP